MTRLSDLLNDAKGDRSIDALIEAAEKRGSVVDRSVLYRALKGDHAKQPREATLQGFAAVLGLDVRRLRQAVAMPAGELGAWKPTPESARLSRDQRRALDQLIKTIVRGEEGERDDRPAATKTPDSGPGNIIEIAGQAARKTGRPTKAQERRRRTQDQGEKDDGSPS